MCALSLTCFTFRVRLISYFIQEQAQLTSVDHLRGGNIANLTAIEQTRMLAHTISQNDDPKFQVMYNWLAKYMQSVLIALNNIIIAMHDSVVNYIYIGM